MATTTLLSLADYTALYNRAATAPDAVVTARLLDMSAAVMRYIGWPINAAGDLTMASTSHILTVGDDYPLWDDDRITLPITFVSAVGEVRVGADTAGTAGADYDVLTSGIDYRAQLADPLRPALRWLSGVSGEELRVACTAGVAAIPEDLRQAVGRLTAWSLGLDLRQGRASISDPQMATTAYRDEAWPPDVVALLRPHLCPHVRAVRK
ncbi:MAG: hypothetical protein EBR73_12645 [Rhodobacteraceae bacterium]|jgi:hypothetical protein|nr:hypothetical protein [Paracoccaceae bacterium]